MKNRIFILTVMWFCTAAHAAESIYYYNSEPGDYIGQGEEVILTTDDVDFSAQLIFGNGVQFAMNNFDMGGPTIWWFAVFAPVSGMPLVEGSYEDATRWPFQDPSDPGLSIFGQGRGCNRSSGRFDVLEAVYDPSTGEVISFAVDFEQHCEFGDPALFGSLRFNSDVPISVLLPPKITLENPLNGDGCVEADGPGGATLSLSGSSTSTSPLAYEWSTSTGLSGTGPSFSLDLALDESAQVTLTIEDLTTGERRQASIETCVSDTTPPQITILSPEEGETFIGENLFLEVDISDVVDSDIEEFDMFVGTTRTVALDADGTSRVAVFRKSRGSTVEMQINVEAMDSSGNVGTETVTVYRQHDASAQGNPSGGEGVVPQMRSSGRRVSGGDRRKLVGRVRGGDEEK